MEKRTAPIGIRGDAVGGMNGVVSRALKMRNGAGAADGQWHRGVPLGDHIVRAPLCLWELCYVGVNHIHIMCLCWYRCLVVRFPRGVGTKLKVLRG